MINTKGEHSLFNILYEKGLILTIEADFSHNLRSFTDFYVNIQLTDEGLEKLEVVLKIFSNYLLFINEEGIQEWIFEEIKRMNELRFYFKIKEKPLGYVESLACRLHSYSFEELLIAPFIYQEFDPSLIANVL